MITADDRLDKIADDFVEHCTTRWESGKSMLVCIDKSPAPGCTSASCRAGRPNWRKCRRLPCKKTLNSRAPQTRRCGKNCSRKRERLRQQAAWMEQTIIEIDHQRGAE